MLKDILLFTFCMLVFTHSFSQGKVEGLPITVMLNTSVNLPNGAVELTGVSNSLDKEPGEVLIEIIKPGGTTDKLTARADNVTGKYFVKYTPVAMGKYDVTAYASDRKQTAKTSFEVSAELEIHKFFEDFDKAKTKALTSMESSVNAAIAPLAKADDLSKAKAEIQKVKQKVKEFDDSWSKMKQALDDLQKLAKKHPDINAIAAPQLGKLSSELNQSSDLLKQIEKDFGTSKTQTSDDCDKLYKVSESCAAFSTAMNVTSGGLIAIGKSVFIDKVWPKIAEKIAPKSFTENDNFVFKQAGKAGLTATDGLSALKTKSFGAGLFGDFVQYISDDLFKKYCAEYKGPVSGDYTCEFKSNGKTYMKYKLTYEGKASVYCRKDKLDKINNSIPKLSGYLEGNVTSMEFTDDVWAVEDKSDWDEVKYQRIPAPVVPISTSENDPGFGAVARGTVPGSFYFPLQAQMVQGKMIIKLMPARSEFTQAFANRTVMVVRAKKAPHNLDGAVFQYPIATARFILTRSMRMDDKSPTVTLDIKTQNGVGTMEKDFTRSEAPDENTKVDFNMKLKLSNK